VAVADFRCAGRAGAVNDGKAVAELLRTALDRRYFRLVERSDLSAILDERALATGRIVAAVTASSGKLRGVRYLIVGSVVNVGRYYVVARMVDVSSGEVTRTAQASAADRAGLQAAAAQVARALAADNRQQERRRSGSAEMAAVSSASPEAASDVPSGIDAAAPPVRAQRSTAPDVSRLPVRLRCLWAEIRMLQRCLGAEELLSAPQPTGSRAELTAMLAELEAEKAILTMQIRAGQAVVSTTPVQTEPPPRPIRLPNLRLERTSTPVNRGYRRSVGPQVSFRPMGRLGFGRRRKASIRRRR